MFLFAVITLAGCKERCNPAFPLTLVDYFPYVVGGEYKFTTRDQERTLVFTVNDMKVSEEECFPWNCKCEGPAYTYFTASSDSIKIKGQMHAGEGYFKINTTVGEQRFLNETSCNPFVDNAIEFIGDTIILAVKGSGNKCVVVRGKGIMEVEYGDETWVLIE